MVENEHMQALLKKLMKTAQQVQAYLQLHTDDGVTPVALVAVGMDWLSKNKLVVLREIVETGTITVGERQRILVKMNFEISDVETLSSMKYHWYGDSALGVSEAARNAEISFLLHVFGVRVAVEPTFEQQARQQSQPAAKNGNGRSNGQSANGNDNSYTGRSGDFYTLLSKKLAELKQPNYRKNMDNLVKLLEGDGTLKAGTEYKQAVDLIIERVKTFEAAK